MHQSPLRPSAPTRHRTCHARLPAASPSRLRGVKTGSNSGTMIAPTFSKPQMVNPWSSWAPSAARPNLLHQSNDQYQGRSHLTPPRFDGSDANNWIRGIQYYFDHVGIPKNHRLHFVIPLFDPPVADWIWNYCSSHEFASWYEFLEDVSITDLIRRATRVSSVAFPNSHK